MGCFRDTAATEKPSVLPRLKKKISLRRSQKDNAAPNAAPSTPPSTAKPSVFRRLKNRVSLRKSKKTTPDSTAPLPTQPTSEKPASAERPSPSEPTETPASPQVQAPPTPPPTPPPEEKPSETTTETQAETSETEKPATEKPAGEDAEAEKPATEGPEVEKPTATTPERLEVDNLWDEAIEALDDKHKAMLKGIDTSGNRTDILTGLLQTVQQRHEEVEAKQWKFSFKGKTIVLRDVTSNILGWVQKYMAIGDMVAMFEPMVGTPWAVIKFMVQLGTGDSEMMGQMLVAVEHITNLLDRCELYEALHVQNNKNPTKSQLHLRKTLIMLYTTVLEFLIDALQYIAMNTAARTFASIGEQGAFDTSGIEGLELTISMAFSVAEADSTRSAQNSLNDTAQATLRALLDDVCVPLVKIEYGVSELRREVEAKQRLQILDFYSKLPYGLHHKRASLDRVAGTGQWLLDTTQYQRWTSLEQTSVLWIHGVPGTGKTRLASAVIDYLIASGSSGEAVVYHYCNEKDPERTNPESILRSFLRQLATNTRGGPVDEVLVADYNKRKLDAFAAGVPNLEECVELLTALLAKRTTGCYFVIDGLDSCPEDDGDMWDFLSGLFAAAQASPKPVKLVVASRDAKQIVSWMKSTATVHKIYLGGGEMRNAADLEGFVREEVQRSIGSGVLLDGEVDEELRNLICWALVVRARGLFEWCRDQIEHLCSFSFRAEVEAELNRLPDLMQEAYETAMEEIGNQKPGARLIGLLALCWAAWRIEPLTVNELCDAIYMRCSETMPVARKEVTPGIIEKSAKYLVVVDQETGLFRTSHTTLIEYLNTHGLLGLDESAFHGMAATLCLRVLIQLSDSDGNRNMDNDGLKWYAAKHWMSHVRLSTQEGQYPPSVFEALNEFFGTVPHAPSRAYLYWYGVTAGMEHSKDTDPSFADTLHKIRGSPINPLCLAAVRGFHQISLWRAEFDPNYRNGRGESLLSLGISSGYITTPRYIVERGHSPNSISDNSGFPVIFTAISSRNLMAVELLLKNGADPNIRAPDGKTPLQYASSQGQDDVVKLLFYYGAKVDDEKEQCDSTTLQCAAASESRTGIQELITQGADVNSLGGQWNSPLEAALVNRRDKTVRDLLNAGAKAVYPASYTAPYRYGTPLLAACRPHSQQDLEIIDLIISQVSTEDVNDTRGAMGTPLIVAASAHHGSPIIERLLAKGADPTLAGGVFGNFAGSAAYHGTTAALHKAAELGVDCDSVAGYWGSPLAMACWSHSGEWNREIVQWFISHGADVNRISGEYGTALQCAAANGRLDLAEELLAAGADVNLFSEGGYGSALQAALSTGHDEIAQLLLSHGAEVNPVLALDSEKAPSRWEPSRRIPHARVSDDGLDVCYSTETPFPVTLLTDNSIPLREDFFYFEITILPSANPSPHNPPKVTIGLALRGISPFSRPGDTASSLVESWGYDSETGALGTIPIPGIEWPHSHWLRGARKYGEGMTVGMGVLPKKRIAFYTRDGEFEGVGAVGLKGRLYPAVGLASSGVTVRANFGNKEFLYAGVTDEEVLEKDLAKKYGIHREAPPLPSVF